MIFHLKFHCHGPGRLQQRSGGAVARRPEVTVAAAASESWNSVTVTSGWPNDDSVITHSFPDSHRAAEPESAAADRAESNLNVWSPALSAYYWHIQNMQNMDSSLFCIL